MNTGEVRKSGEGRIVLTRQHYAGLQKSSSGFLIIQMA